VPKSTNEFWCITAKEPIWCLSVSTTLWVVQLYRLFIHWHVAYGKFTDGMFIRLMSRWFPKFYNYSSSTVETLGAYRSDSQEFHTAAVELCCAYNALMGCLADHNIWKHLPFTDSKYLHPSTFTQGLAENDSHFWLSDQHIMTDLMNVLLPSVLWRCWSGSRKGIWHVKIWVVGCWHGYLSAARCRLAYGPADATATHCLLLQ